MDGNCLTESVVYQAIVKNNRSDNTKTYIGLTEGTFKQRFYGHTSSFKHEKQEKSTGLSKYIWQRKRANEKYIPSNGPSYVKHLPTTTLRRSTIYASRKS